MNMDANGTESLLEMVDQLRKKAEDSNKADASLFKKRTSERSHHLACLGASAFAEGAFEKALDWLTQAINVFPSAKLYTKRSVVHLALQHNVLAAADAVSAIGADPNNASGYLCAALSRIRLGEYEEGLKNLEKLRKCFPNSKKINSIYVTCRNSYWLTGKIQPFEPPTSIAKDLIHEEYSAFDESKLNDLKVELSTSGVLVASKLTEDFVRRVIETYKRGVFHLPQKYVFMILKNVLDILREHSNIISIDISSKQTLTVVGDLRGKFNNLLSIFRHNRTPHFGRPYLFNGNIIGNDKMSLPVLIIVLCLKILFPEDVFINRGSEECLEMCETNGFETEVLTVYDEDTMKGFTEVFTWLPVAHILNNNVLIIHGGLFEDDKLTLAELQDMNRHYQPPDSGPMCDILYSDPWNYRGISKKGRRRGVWFGPDVTERFCLHNCIDYIVRSHQDVGEFGYEVQTYRQCLTVDSSTNYATYLVIRGKTSSFKAVHARKDRLLPKHCKCFLICNCKSPGDPNQADPLHDGYVTTNMTLPSVPLILKETSEDDQTDPSKKSMSKADRTSDQSFQRFPSAKASSKSILITSKKLTAKSSELRVNFNPPSKSSLMKTESAPFPRQAIDKEKFLSESVKIVSANYPAPSLSSGASTPSGVSVSKAERAGSRASSKSQGITNLSRTISSSNASSVGLAPLGNTNSKAKLTEIPQAAANVTSEPIQRKDESEDIIRTLFLSSKENNVSSQIGFIVDSSPETAHAVVYGSLQNVNSTANAHEKSQTHEPGAARSSQMMKDTRIKPIYSEFSEIQQNDDDDEPVGIELLDEPNARTSEMYSKLASTSGKYTM